MGNNVYTLTQRGLVMQSGISRKSCNVPREGVSILPRFRHLMQASS